MRMRIGYIYFTIPSDDRLSDKEHRRRLGAEALVIDYGNDPKGPRHRLHELLESLSNSDYIIVDSVSELGKTVRDFLIVWDELASKGICLISLKENFDTSDPNDSKIAGLLSSLYGIDSRFLKDRQRPGSERARERGAYKGKVPIEVDSGKWDEVIKLWESGDITAIEAMKRLGLKRNTFYRRIQAIGAKKGKGE